MSGFSKDKIAIADILVWALISSYILFFGYISFLRYRCFDYGDMDLAIYSQMLWNIIHGSLHSTIIGVNLLGHHAHVLFLIAPVYFLFQTPLTLLFIQTFFLAIAAYPIFLIAREELNPKMALAIVVIYLLYPALGYTNMYEFHVPVFATAFLAFMFYYFKKADFKGFVLFMLLSLLCQENISLIIIPVGIYAFFVKKGIKWAAVPILSGGVWFWIMVGKVIPYINKDTVAYFSIYDQMGNSISEIAKFMITHPVHVAKIIITRWNMVFLLALFMPLCFFSILSPQILIILPVLMQHLLSKRLLEQTIYGHYTAEMIPIIFISAIYGIKRFFKIPYIKRNLRQGIFISIILVSAIISNICLGPHIRLIVEHKQFRRDIWDYQKQYFINMVPNDAGVVATFEFLPRLCHRKNLYSFHQVVSGFYTLSNKPFQLPGQVKYALLDFNDIFAFGYLNPYFGPITSARLKGKSDVNLRNFIQNDNWGVVDMVGSIVLLKKNYITKYILYQVLDELPEVSNPTSAIAEGEVELIGYDVGDKENTKKNQIELTFFWRALKETKRDYGCFIYILDKEGKTKYRFIKPICYRIYPCYAWQREKVIKEDYKLLLPQDAKEDFSIKMGIFDYKNKENYRFVSSVPDAVDDGEVNLRI